MNRRATQAAPHKWGFGLEYDSELDHHLVDVAPAPVLARLERAHEGVVGGVEVAGGVVVLRRVAVADVAAGEAEAQVHPGVPHLQASLTGARLRRGVLELV